MKVFLAKTHLVTIFLIFINVSFSASQNKILKEGYYVVVAAYSLSNESFAQRYSEKLNNSGREAAYGFSHYKNLYFVYLHYDQDFRSGLTEMRRTRQDEQFNDAWVYVMGSYTPQEEKRAGVEEKPALVKKKPEAVITTDTLQAKQVKEEIKEKAKGGFEERVVYQETQQFHNKEPEQLTLEDFLVFFNLFNSANLKDVTGDVQVIDAQRASLLDVLPGGNYHVLRNPNNGNGELLLIADIFGYRKMQKSINYNNPLQDSATADVNILADIYVVDFGLVRYHVGDIATMFHVYFYRDAAMMLPDSRYELMQLLSMMKENPHYKIRIHGHTNGKSPGKIITMGEDRDFFQLTSDDVEGYGSARKLSEERAQVIKDYLVENGIAPDRMKIKAWGGKRMLYDKHSSQAKKNVRVEIEIIEE